MVDIQRMIEKIKDLIKDYYHLIIPILSLAFYALVNLIRTRFIPYLVDFRIFCNAAQKIVNDPVNLYNFGSSFYSLPALAYFFSPLAFFNINVAYYIYLVYIFCIASLAVLEFNKILDLKGMKKKSQKLLFLFVMSNGWMIYFQFYHNQTKFMVLFIFLFVTRRELEFNIEQKEKDLKFYTINYFLLVFTLAIAPYLVFLFMIYFLHDILKTNQELFDKDTIVDLLKKFSIMVVSFIIQNMVFLIYPQTIFDFLTKGVAFSSYSPYKNTLELFYVREFLVMDEIYRTIIRITTVIIALILSVFVSFQKEWTIDKKLSRFCFVYLFINTYNSLYIFVVLIPFTCFFLVDFIEEESKEEELLTFVKNNKILMIALISLSILAFMIRAESIFNLLPFLRTYPLSIIVFLRWLFIIPFLIVSVIILYNQQK